jgi:DNA-binding transcriptional regulator GbsR (MarR family)
MRQDAFEIRDIRKKEQFVVDDTYLNGYAKVYGIYATGVYVALCRHADISNQTCFSSISLITRKLSISRRQMIRALQVLEDWNIIRRERTEDRRNRYWLIDKKHWKKTSARQAP